MFTSLTLTREQMIEGTEIQVTRIGGVVETGKFVEIKTHRGNDFKWHKYAILKFEYPSSDGVYVSTEAFKIK